MNVTIQETAKSDTETCITVKGEIDVYTAPELREKVLPLCARKQHKVVVDLSEVTYMDSTGLGVLIGAYKASQKVDGEFIVTGVTARVERLFNITGLNELITIEKLQIQGDDQ